MDLIQKVKQFLTETAQSGDVGEKIDYLLVNSTNEFLVEYSDLSENSRYFLTKFCGSTGDALLSTKDLFLFVDGRYHEQASQEVDESKVKVVKMKMNHTFTEYLVQKIKPNKTLAIVAKKNSQGRYEVLKGVLDKKNVKIKLLDFDPVMKFVGEKSSQKSSLKVGIEQIDTKLSGLSSEEKLKKVTSTIKTNEIGRAHV